MVPVEKLLDPYAVSLGCHTAAASPAIPGSIIATPWKITILYGVAIMRKCPCRLRLRSLSCIVAHEQPSLHGLPAWHLHTRSSAIGLESIHSNCCWQSFIIRNRELAMIVTLPWTL